MTEVYVNSKIKKNRPHTIYFFFIYYKWNISLEEIDFLNINHNTTSFCLFY